VVGALVAVWAAFSARGLGRLIGAAGLYLVVAFAGPAYAINGATQARGYVDVVATLEPDVEASEDHPRPDVLGQRAPAGVLVHDDGQVVVSAWGSTRAEQLLARGDSALLGLTVGAAALLLLPVLGSISAGEPFRRGNARRFAVLAAVVAVHGVAAPLLPAAATSSVLRRTGLSELGVFEPESVTFGFLPLVVVVGLLVLAEAFRRGEQLADDVEGLV